MADGRLQIGCFREIALVCINGIKEAWIETLHGHIFGACRSRSRSLLLNMDTLLQRNKFSFDGGIALKLCMLVVYTKTLLMIAFGASRVKVKFAVIKNRKQHTSGCIQSISLVCIDRSWWNPETNKNAWRPSFWLYTGVPGKGQGHCS